MEALLTRLQQSAVGRWLTTSNLVSAILLAELLVGVYVVATTDLALIQLWGLLDEQALAYGIATGLAGIAFAKAKAVEPLVSLAALYVCFVVGTTLFDVLTSKVTYEAGILAISPWVAGLAIGKGLVANNRTTAEIGSRLASGTVRSGS